MAKNGGTTFFITSPSRPISPTVMAAATTLLGQIRLPNAAPAFCPAQTTIGFNPNCSAASTCIGANIILEPKPVPVINAPKLPMATATGG